MNDKTEQTVTDALRRAFSLGQIYWQQADSEYISQHRKVDATRAKFQELCERTEDTIDTLRAQLAEAQKDARRLDWLTFNISGKALRDIGVIWSEHGDARRAIDAARAQQEER